MPWRFISSRICSRNFRGMFLRAAISPIMSESPSLARATKARRAYFAFCEIKDNDSQTKSYGVNRVSKPFSLEKQLRRARLYGQPGIPSAYEHQPMIHAP